MRSIGSWIILLMLCMGLFFVFSPNTVMATDTNTMDYDNYAVGQQVDENWLTTEKSHSTYDSETTGIVSRSGLVSYKFNKAGVGGGAWYNFTNTDFESITFYFYITIAGSDANAWFDFYFRNTTGTVMFYFRMETDNPNEFSCWLDVASTQSYLIRDTSPEDWDDEWHRCTIEKTADNAVNISIYTVGGDFYRGQTDVMSSLWSLWNGSMEVSTTNEPNLHQLYIDDLSYNGGSGGVGTATGNTTINVYNESDPSVAIPDWTLLVYDEYGGVYHSSNGNDNPVTLDHSVYGTGETYFEIGADGYDNRTYYADIRNGINYVLDAFLSYENDSHLYYIRVLDTQAATIHDAEIHITSAINGSLQEIASGFTNAFGTLQVHLIENNVYFVNISKPGYESLIKQDIVADDEDYGEEHPIEFVLQTEIDEYLNATFPTEAITFNGYISSSVLYFNYSDLTYKTTDTSIVVYEINVSQDTVTEFAWDNRTSESVFLYNAGTINESNCYRATVWFNHSNYSTQNLPSNIICGGMVKYRGLTSKTKFDELLDAVFDDNPFGWSYLFGFFILILGVFAFGPQNSGISMLLAGGLMLYMNTIIGLNLIDTLVPILFIVFGVLVLWHASMKRVI